MAIVSQTFPRRVLLNIPPGRFYRIVKDAFEENWQIFQNKNKEFLKAITIIQDRLKHTKLHKPLK